jgi:hypothetical protein
LETTACVARDPEKEEKRACTMSFFWNASLVFPQNGAVFAAFLLSVRFMDAQVIVHASLARL